jgi:hypothetical protein
VKIVKLGAGERLLLYANTHRFLLLRDFLGVAGVIISLKKVRKSTFL